MNQVAKHLVDVEVPNPPNDSISSLAFSPTAELLAVGSWDNEVRIYEVHPSDGKTQGRAMYQHEGPVLTVCWNKEGTKLFSGGVDNAARMHDLATGKSFQVAQHEAPVKSVRWIESPQGGILATGSWDKTLKYWDLRSASPVATVQLPERCYSMDVVYPLLVVATAERHIQIFNLANPTVPYKSITSPLKKQTRVVKCFLSADGFAVGSVEGRVAVNYLEEKETRPSYTFRCHRKEISNPRGQVDVYAVNDINFHPANGTCSTAGSDGVTNFWRLDARIRTHTLDKAPGPISASAFNSSGSIFAYAVSYDWSKGHTGMKPGQPNKVMLHAVKDAELRNSLARK